MLRRRFLFILLTFTLFLACNSLEAKKKPPLHPINLNTAGSTQLQQVPGIGPATADKILKMRKSYGPFKSVDDLCAIKGIGPKCLEKMRKYLTVTVPSAKKTTQPAKTAGQTKSPSSSDKSQPAENSSPESSPELSRPFDS